MSAAGSNAALLTKAMRDLLVHWDATGNAWRDKARDDFHKDFIEELKTAVRGASLAAQEIENLLSRVKNDCK